MSAIASLSYPQNFLRRPVDRDLIDRLVHSGLPSDTAELMLFRLWQEFGNGASDRRKLGDASFADDRAALGIEKACLWPGDSGMLILMATDAEFLELDCSDVGGDRWLVCRDFYPLNSNAGKGGMAMQRKGAYSRVLKPAIAKADQDADRHLELWNTTRPEGLGEFDDEARKRALIFLHRVARAAARIIPSDATMRRLVGDAVKCLDETNDEAMHATLLYLISQRKELPEKLSVIVGQWPEIVEKAKRDAM